MKFVLLTCFTLLTRTQLTTPQLLSSDLAKPPDDAPRVRYLPWGVAPPRWSDMTLAEPDDNAEELDDGMIYGIQNSQRSALNDLSAHIQERANRQPKEHFQSICEADRDLVTLSDREFEYRPSHYHEVRCRHTSLQSERSNRVCNAVDFACVQLNRTIFLTRRRYNSECWEYESRIVPAGCECMWPTHILGDIQHHH